MTDAFRAEVRDWLAAHVPAAPLPSLDTAEGFEAHRAWERSLAAARLAVVTAKALSLPALILADAEARLSKIRSVWPDSTESCAGAAPLYGIWTMLTCAMLLNSSPERCPALPLPPDA